MRKGFLIYEEMRKYLVIYEEAGSHMTLQPFPSEFPYIWEFFSLFYLVYLSLWEFHQEINMAVLVKFNETRYENVHLHIVQLCISHDMEPKINFGDLPPYLTYGVHCLSPLIFTYCIYSVKITSHEQVELHLLTNWQHWQKGFHSSLKIFFDYRRVFPVYALTW